MASTEVKDKVEVRDDKNELIGKVFVGDTAKTALERLGRAGPLLFWDGTEFMGMSASDVIAKGTKYQVKDNPATGSSKRQKPKQSWNAAIYTAETVPRPTIHGMFDFVAPPGWMKTLCDKLIPQYELLETDQRVSPIALIRCSRGGKTRTMKELAKYLPTNIPVLFVSFNEYSSLLPYEQADPLAALCLRIAFVATKRPPFHPGDFTTFRETWQADVAAVKGWLGTSDCILMIDELNQAELLQHNSPEGTEFVEFLKDNFLQPRNRMLVFSSHLATLSDQLVNFFGGSTSGRGVITQQLPKIPSFEAGKILDPRLTARSALYCGLIPALIIARNWPENIVDVKIPPGITDQEVLQFLTTFITGDSNSVPAFMVPFMDLTAEKRSVWIPFHVHRLFIQLSLSGSLSMYLRKFMGALAELLSAFATGKLGSGDGFESLFTFTYLIRALSGMCESFVKPGYKSISFNEALDRKGQDIDRIESLEELDKNLAVPVGAHFPHLAVFLPQFSAFHKYDVLVYLFTDPKTYQKDGFQLKEGEDTPKQPATEGVSSFWIRGRPPEERSSFSRGWDFVHEGRLVTFFGVSGKDWIPRRLIELREKL